ncbi:MAG: Hpt domain-containing protein, partial [Gammaproteobacteria bacterium]|nr:Hpt domain-containing protein [Gammaproteobacteria bacterium]
MDIDPKLMEQLLETFRVELDDQLQAITEGLLRLEKHPQADVRQEILKQIFRAAHNIKGAARGVGIADVAEITHQLESLLSALKESNTPPTAGVIDLCLEAIDKTGQAMKAYDAGIAADFDMPYLLERLEQTSCQPTAPGNEPESEPQPQPESKPGPVRVPEPDAPARPAESAARVAARAALPQDESQAATSARDRDDSPG